ncbi:hypothetical protein ANO11243_075450 [Dothideomycetidae sp. 11243]|nr:hypothetical protein ANO11243_075450 [fungal sp. No.11243]
MKASIILSVLSAAAVSVNAMPQSNCVQGLTYCGSVLLTRGNYYQDILNSLNGAGQPTDSNHISNSLFYCASADGVPFQQFCGTGCVNGGDGNSDHCN